MISIIIPVYNAQSQIEKCVKSIQAQTITEWKLILVDDGSCDQTPAICDKLAYEDNRIKVIHKQNGGVSSARNAGLNVANTEYVMFIDADDWAKPTLCENLIAYSKEADWVVGGYNRIFLNRTETVSCSSQKFDFPKDVRKIFENLYANSLMNSPWAKIYKRTVLGTQMFDIEAALGEDLLFNLEYLSKCKSVATVGESDYFYNCLNDNAATKKMREDDVDQILNLYNRTLEFEELYCGCKSARSLVDQAFVAAGIGVLQRVFYSDISFKKKKKLAKKLTSTREYMQCCKASYKMPRQYKIIQNLGMHECYEILGAFFMIKKGAYKIMRFMVNRT